MKLAVPPATLAAVVSCTLMFVVPPVNAVVPAPVTPAPDVKLNVPPPKPSVAPLATVNDPVLDPPPAEIDRAALHIHRAGVRKCDAAANGCRARARLLAEGTGVGEGSRAREAIALQRVVAGGVKIELATLDSVEPLSMLITPPDQVVVKPARARLPPLRYCVVLAPVIVPPPLIVTLPLMNVPPDQASAPETPTDPVPPKLPLLKVKAASVKDRR